MINMEKGKCCYYLNTLNLIESCSKGYFDSYQNYELLQYNSMKYEEQLMFKLTFWLDVKHIPSFPFCWYRCG